MKGSERDTVSGTTKMASNKYHIIKKIQPLKAVDVIQHAAGTSIDEK